MVADESVRAGAAPIGVAAAARDIASGRCRAADLRRPRRWVAARGRTLALALALASVASLPAPAGASAQDPDSLPGVALSLLYEGVHRPTVAVAPFTGVGGGESLATQAEAIVARDLDYSDRFELSSVPPALFSLAEIDYGLWDRAGVDYLVRGRVEPEEDGFALYVEVHDIVYGRLLGVRRSALPLAGAAGFRMAVHGTSDAVVENVFDEPGVAATRIAFSMRPPGSPSKDLYVVDSDGENLRRVSRHDLSILSPSWHPDGERVAFLSLSLEGEAAIYEVNLRTGGERRLPSLGQGQVNTPVYLPGGERIAVTLDRGFSSRIVSWDLARECCAVEITDSRAQDLSPAFSPDGRWLAFTSNRLGAPLVFVQPAGGGEAALISPFVAGVPADFTAPEWSPRGRVLAYHGSLGRRQRYQIVATELGDGVGVTRTIRLTSEGSSESPSWGPDGRHLVFVGERADGTALYVLDAATGRTRRLLSGSQLTTPAWSPSLGGEPLAREPG
jgi:TolB protein